MSSHCHRSLTHSHGMRFKITFLSGTQNEKKIELKIGVRCRCEQLMCACRMPCPCIMQSSLAPTCTNTPRIGLPCCSRKDTEQRTKIEKQRRRAKSMLQGGEHHDTDVAMRFFYASIQRFLCVFPEIGSFYHLLWALTRYTYHVAHA